MHGFQLWANLPASLKMTAPRYQDVSRAGHSRGRRRRRDERAGGLRRLLGEARAGGRHRRRSAVSRRVGAARQRKTLPVETTRHAFAYVFAGSGTFRNASPPLRGQDRRRPAISTPRLPDAKDRSLILFDSGDEVTVQAGERASGSCSSRASRSRSRSPGMADRDEYRSGAAAGVPGNSGRHLHQVARGRTAPAATNDCGRETAVHIFF